MNRWVSGALLLAIIGGLALRIPDLTSRPLHNDEGVNAYKFGQLWTTGSYKYDPNEHHGPTLYYASFLFGKITGAPSIDRFSEGRLRLMIVLFGIGVIGCLPLLIDGLGRRGTIWAGIYTALSPAMVYYSRYYIHEIPLVFFTFLALGAGWRYWRSRKPGWALLAGAALGLMHSTKETFVITLVAAGLALALNQAWNRWLDATGPPLKARPLNPWHLVAAFAVWLFVAILLFSSFFTNASGPIDSVRTYLPWLNRAAGDSPHIHPWYFYLQRLFWFHVAKGPIWTEALIGVLAAFGAWAGFARRKLGRASASFVRFLALYTVGLASAYSLISYKTPWCFLSFWHGAILLAGVGTAVLLRSMPSQRWRFAVLGVLLAGLAHFGWLAWAASFKYAALPANPYVYAHTSPDLLRLVRRIESIADVSPQGRKVLIKAMSPDGDFWPLPWYLRSFENIGWWSQIPADPYAPMMLVSAKYGAGFDENKTHLMIGYFQLRPDTFFELYVELELWKRYLASNPAPEQ